MDERYLKTVQQIARNEIHELDLVEFKNVLGYVLQEDMLQEESDRIIKAVRKACEAVEYDEDALSALDDLLTENDSAEKFRLIQMIRDASDDLKIGYVAATKQSLSPPTDSNVASSDVGKPGAVEKPKILKRSASDASDIPKQAKKAKK